MNPGIQASRHEGMTRGDRPERLGASLRRRGFTLIELMIAIAVLLVVIAATAHIFGTASKVTGTGHAAAGVMQEAAVIERMLRDDIARLSAEGFFAIRQVAVRNDVHGDAAPLLNPMLPAGAWLRADQLVFFADGVETPQTSRINEAGLTRGQSLSSRIYYGHAFQLPDGLPYEWVSIFQGFTYDPQNHVLPWHRGTVVMNRTSNQTGGGTSSTNFGVTNAGTINGTQPDARHWLLARQPVILADDDAQAAHTDAKTVYMGEIATERSILINNFPITGVVGYTNQFFARMIRNGRLDGAATRLDAVKLRTQRNQNGTVRLWHDTTAPWDQQRYISAQAIYYPRAERIAPSPHRPDQALTNHVIGSAVSSFSVEWTYADGTGDLYDNEGNLLCRFDNGDLLPCDTDNVSFRQRFGFYTNFYDPAEPLYEFQPEQPWFGLNLPDRGVGRYGDWTTGGYQQRANFKPAGADTTSVTPGSASWEYIIFPNNLEWFGNGSEYVARIGPEAAPFNTGPSPAERVQIYEAIFGYNRNRPTAPNPATTPNWYDEAYFDLGYTPWPSAIRVTMTLHDPQGRMEHGREFQFVIDLPKRTRK